MTLTESVTIPNKVISHKHKFVYMHIPKTGGASIESVLRAVPDIHDTSGLDQIKRYKVVSRAFLENSNYTYFTICRNTYERIVSAYLHSKRRRRRGFHGTFLEMLNAIKSSNSYNTLGRFCYRHTVSQLYFIPGHKDARYNLSRVDLANVHIGDFKNLQLEFEKFVDKLNIDVSSSILPNKRHSRSGSYNYRDFFEDKDTLDVFHSIYEKEIEYFNYKL